MQCVYTASWVTVHTTVEAQTCTLAYNLDEQHFVENSCENPLDRHWPSDKAVLLSRCMGCRHAAVFTHSAQLCDSTELEYFVKFTKASKYGHLLVSITSSVIQLVIVILYLHCDKQCSQSNIGTGAQVSVH